jgi:hypothetical protein
VTGRRHHTRARLALLLAACFAACSPDDASRYRLSGTGTHWDRAGGQPIAEELGAIYPDYFEIILDPSSTREPDLRPLRDDLEAQPTRRRNYDALNAIAIGYFELNYRAEASRGGATYLADSFRATKLVAVPWRAYSEIDDGALRGAILAFFEDAASGEKLGTASTAPRLVRIVGSLRAKESDPRRIARME